MKKLITEIEKQSIIATYLQSTITFRDLGKQHGISHETIKGWVRKFRGHSNEKQQMIEIESPDKDLPTDVRALQAALRKERLRNELLNTVIDIAESELKVSIRKKSGTKR